jgi:hypothetical protein
MDDAGAHPACGIDGSSSICSSLWSRSKSLRIAQFVNQQPRKAASLRLTRSKRWIIAAGLYPVPVIVGSAFPIGRDSMELVFVHTPPH